MLSLREGWPAYFDHLFPLRTEQPMSRGPSMASGPPRPTFTMAPCRTCGNCFHPLKVARGSGVCRAGGTSQQLGPPDHLSQHSREAHPATGAGFLMGSGLDYGVRV